MNTTTEWSKSYRVEVGGDEVGSHAGNVITRMLADRTGLTEALSDAISRPEVTHDRGALLRDVAVSIADGATNLSGSRVLRDQKRLFGQVASLPTMWRGLNEIDAAALEAIVAARSKVRALVWELIADKYGRIPPVRTAYDDLGDVVCIRIDASLVQSHSDKQHAAGNFRAGTGFTPCWHGVTTPGNCSR